MIQKIIGFIIICGIIISCQNQPEKNYAFTIHGNIADDYSGVVFLYRREAGGWIMLDSADVENCTDFFSGNI